ncbi:MAG: methionine gamma-lyase [Robiginitomaculum sp.]|nr:MAG: methionine gamma-lyase [Robiginitomaculum sp.]
MHDNKQAGFSTRAIHTGYDGREAEGAINPPVYMSSTFAFDTTEQGAARFAGEAPGHFYSRISNPTLQVLETRFADLENAEAGLSFASGMGAITSVLWTFLSAGDEIITDKTLYGCTFAFLQHGLARFGVKVTTIDLSDPLALQAAINPKTKIVFFESPANPNMKLVDIAAIAKIARANGAKTIIDNTYCTPYLQRPLDLGADIVVHSATKYLSGHGDLIAGLAAGNADDMLRVRTEGLKDMTGAVLDPLSAHQLMRGIKTLALRMDRHCASALTLAQHLQSHQAIAQIRYPGLPSFPQYELAQKQMLAGGGLITLELAGGYHQAVRFMNQLQLIKRAVSLGDADSLIQHPASMTHSAYTPDERAEYGISESLIRLSVGLEDVDDIWNDIEQALASLEQTKARAA